MKTTAGFGPLKVKAVGQFLGMTPEEEDVVERCREVMNMWGKSPVEERFKDMVIHGSIDRDGNVTLKVTSTADSGDI